MAQNPLVFAAWARVFSPLLDETLRREAWEQLDLPADFSATQPALWKAFHIGLPQPPAPLLLHVLLGVDGGALRETMVRILEYLDLDWSDHRLPPDHLACVLELLGLAATHHEPVLVEGLRERYVSPWCERAYQALQSEPAMASLVERLREDVGG
jgi:hypothetical protein